MRGILFVFLGVAVLQLAVPASMILRREQVLREGGMVQFRTAPVDPYDAFRGRYVALRYADNTVPLQDGAGQSLKRGMRIYVVLEENEEGFVQPVSYSLSRPEEGRYLRVPVQWVNKGSRMVQLDYPFDRYYMNEYEAPRAEQAVRRLDRGNPEPTYVTVRLLDGRAVLEALYLDGKPVHAYLEEEQGQP